VRISRTGGWALLLALPLAAPALCLGQDAGSTGAGASTPDENTPPAATPPTVGSPVAVLPGASFPGAGVPISGVTGALTRLPEDYTSYGVSAGLGESDNVNFSSTHPEAQTLSAANLFFDLIRSGSRLDLNAVGNFSDTDYLEGAYSNQLLGRFDGLADLMLWEHHLKWLVRDDYGDSQINVLESLTPVNLQRINIFSTGPDLTLEPTLSSFVELQGLYSRNTWQNEPFSGNTGTGSLTVGHQFSPFATISLVGEVEQERFDETSVNTDYQVREYYGHYALKGMRTRVDLQGGVAQANDTGSWTSSPLVRLSVSRSVSPFSTVSIAGGRDYSNAMGSFASLANGVTGGIPVGTATQTTGNALRTYGNVSWSYQRLRTSVNLLGNWEREGYDVQSKYNFSLTDVGLNLRRQLTPRLSANILATVDRGEYGNQGFTNDYGTAGAGLMYRPGSWIVIYGRYDHQFRTASGTAHGFGYDENRIFVMVGYYPHSSGTGLPREMGGSGLY
jgi:Putative beta-barrel porin 2